MLKAAAEGQSPMLTISERALEMLVDTVLAEAARPVVALSGPEIAARRKALGWSQADLAEKVGTTQQTVHRVEAGQTTYCRSLPDILDVLAKSGPGRFGVNGRG